MNDQAMDPQPTEVSAAANPNADKYNDPRVKITRRGVLIGVAISILGVLGSVGSIYARRTGLTETTRFWGQETITALQLAERIELLPRGASEFEPIELTAIPGLGHLRHALLEESHFDWSTESPENALQNCGAVAKDAKTPQCLQLRLTDPTAHRIDVVEIDLDLEGGWVGPSDGSRRVRAHEWVRPKLKHYFGTIMTVQQQRYDHRD